jgi:hypothetical protein
MMRCRAVGFANNCCMTGSSLGCFSPFSGAGLGRSIVTSSSGLLRSIIMIDSGATARNSTLLAAVRCRMAEGGVYWTKERENRGGSDELVSRAEGMKPVSSWYSRLT